MPETNVALRSVELTVFKRGEQEWAKTTLTKDSTMHMLEIGVGLPVAELYRAITLLDA